MNRAFAVSRVEGPLAGLALLEATGAGQTREYPYAHLVRGTLLGELGRLEEARASLSTAMENARNPHEAAQIKARIDQLDAADPRGRQRRA